MAPHDSPAPPTDATPRPGENSQAADHDYAGSRLGTGARIESQRLRA
jgi:hypothetical protein